MRKLTILLVAIISLLTMSCNTTKKTVQVNKYIPPAVLNTKVTNENLKKAKDQVGIWVSLEKGFTLYSYNSSVDPEEKIINGGVYQKNTILGEVLHFYKTEPVRYISGPDEEEFVYESGKQLIDYVLSEIVLSKKDKNSEIKYLDIEFNILIDTILSKRTFSWTKRYKNDDGFYLKVLIKSDFKNNKEIEKVGAFVNEHEQVYFEIDGYVYYLVEDKEGVWYLLPKKFKEVALGQFYLKTDNIDAKKRGRSVSKRTLLLKQQLKNKGQ